MNVAVDATPLSLSSGGLRRYVSELSVALAREFPGDTYTLLSDQPFAMPEHAPPSLVRGCRPRNFAERRWWLWGIERVMRQAGSQIFHGTNFEVPYLGGTPAILTIHDLSPWRDKKWHGGADRVRFRAPWLIRLGRARMILTVSEAVRREIIEHFGVHACRVRAIPLAASGQFHALDPPALPRKRYFLFVGTLEPRKNVNGLVEGWRAAREETKADLVIAGRKRADFAEIACCEGLHFRGEVAERELPGLYSDALAFVYPTHYEGFGLPVLEAMQCGCPVITSRDPAVTEVAGGAALQVSGPHEIAEAMRRIAADPELRQELRTQGIKRAGSFSWARTARETRALYAEALSSPRGIPCRC